MACCVTFICWLCFRLMLLGSSWKLRQWILPSRQNLEYKVHRQYCLCQLEVSFSYSLPGFCPCNSAWPPSNSCWVWMSVITFSLGLKSWRNLKFRFNPQSQCKWPQAQRVLLLFLVFRCIQRWLWCAGKVQACAGRWRDHAGDSQKQGRNACRCHPGFCRLSVTALQLRWELCKQQLDVHQIKLPVCPSACCFYSSIW